MGTDSNKWKMRHYRGIEYKLNSRETGFAIISFVPGGKEGANWMPYATEEEWARLNEADIKLIIDRAFNGVVIRPGAGKRGDPFAKNTERMLMSG